MEDNIALKTFKDKQMHERINYQPLWGYYRDGILFHTTNENLRTILYHGGYVKQMQQQYPNKITLC